MFAGQDCSSKLQVTGGKRVLTNCQDGGPWLKSRVEVETVNNNGQVNVFKVRCYGELKCC